MNALDNNSGIHIIYVLYYHTYVFSSFKKKKLLVYYFGSDHLNTILYDIVWSK